MRLRRWQTLARKAGTYLAQRETLPARAMAILNASSLRGEVRTRCEVALLVEAVRIGTRLTAAAHDLEAKARWFARWLPWWPE